MVPTFSILSESVMNSEMIEIPKSIPTGNFAGHKKCFSLVLCLCCSMVSLRVTSFKELDFKDILLHLTPNCTLSASPPHGMWALGGGMC